MVILLDIIPVMIWTMYVSHVRILWTMDVLLCSISHDTNGMPNCIVIEIGITL